MERRVEREFEILTAIAEESSTTQRVLAARLGVALGLTNLYLKRLVKKGYIKVAGFPHRPAARKRLRYLLTARGLTEKSRLTYDYMSSSITSTVARARSFGKPSATCRVMERSVSSSTAPVRPPSSHTSP